MSIPTRSGDRVTNESAIASGALHSVGFISQSRTRTPRRPSRPVAAQTNTAIPIEPAMITHTSGELLYFRTMSPSPTSDLLEQLLVSSDLSRWYA